MRSMLESKGDRNNNLNFGRTGDGNFFSIDQSQHHYSSRNDHLIQFSGEEDSAERVDGKLISKRAIYGYGTILLGLLASASDLLTVFSYFGLTESMLRWAVILVCGVCVLPNVKYIHMGNLPRGKDKYINGFLDSLLLGGGRFVYRDKKGDVLFYRMSATCNYPKCDGTVYAISPPPREADNRCWVGVCSMGCRYHSYSIDPSGVGIPCEIDWRDLDNA